MLCNLYGSPTSALSGALPPALVLIRTNSNKTQSNVCVFFISFFLWGVTAAAMTKNKYQSSFPTFLCGYDKNKKGESWPGSCIDLRICTHFEYLLFLVEKQKPPAIIAASDDDYVIVEQLQIVWQSQSKKVRKRWEGERGRERGRERERVE